MPNSRSLFLFPTLLQFMNKVLYAREGAKSIIDRTFADFPSQVRVEVDGVNIKVPEVGVIDFCEPNIAINCSRISLSNT